MSTNVKGSCVDVLDFKCSAFCNLRIFNEGHQFNISAGMIISSNKFGMTIIAFPNQLCLISMKHVRQLVGDFGVEKNTLSNFLRREIELNFSPNFLDLSCDEGYLAVAGTSNLKPSITIYNIEALISHSNISPLVCINFGTTQGSHVTDMSWNPGLQNSLACCLSDGSLHIIELKDDGTYSVVSLPPQSNTLCLSWSPKGKQIIIGSSNGSLTQYKPELKAVKQYMPPTDVTANIKPNKIKWISNFQFAVIYDIMDNTDNQPSLYILNTPKNAPIEFINFEQYAVMNSEQYRLNQYYTIFQQNWNLLFVASSNCTEIGVMGINNVNQWQCWMLETRPELPYRLDKQMYPLGMSLDLSSQMRIKKLSKSNEEIFIDPMPVLCVLSSDGILFMYHIENQLTDYQNICKPPSDIPDNVVAQLFTTNSKINNVLVDEQVITEVVEKNNVVDEKAKGDHNESVLASYLETSINSQAEQPQIFDVPKVSIVKPVIPATTVTISTVQNVPSQSNLSETNKSTDEAVNQVMLNEVLEDVQIFQSQIEDILKLSLNTSKLKIGDDKDKETLVKKWTSLDIFFKDLNETNRSQWTESKALQKAVLDSIAWVEDSKSRLFFLKNPKYKCLLRNNSDELYSKTLFDNIERTLYYIETQLTHVDDQLKAKYDSYNPNNKELKIPCLETIYKSLVVNTNIVNKLKDKINNLCNTAEEMKYRTFKKISLVPDIIQNTSKLNESRDIGLSKLSEQLLKITLDKDGVSAINSYNIAKKYSVLSANQRALSLSKVNKLQEWLKDFKTRRTKITKSNYANIDLSRPVCSTPLKLVSKQKVQENIIDFTHIVTKENVASILLQTPSQNHTSITNEQTVTEIMLPVSGTTESKEKTPFNFSNMSTMKTEAKSSMPMTFNFAESIKNKMDNPKDTQLNTFNFESPSSSKPSEITSLYTGFNTDKSVNNQETVPTKDVTLSTFNFNSKSDIKSLSTFNFNTFKEDISKPKSSETQDITSTSTAVNTPFNFSLPAKTVPTTISEPTGSTITSSTFGVFKTPPISDSVSIVSSSASVTDTTYQVSESPTPIISEPVTPESENVPTTPNITNNAPIFEMPSTSSSVFGSSINSTNTISNPTSTSAQTSIFSTQTNANSAASIFNSSTTTTASLIFSSSTNTTSTASIFGTAANTTNTSSIFGTSTNTTASSSIFGTATNTTTASSIFDASVSTASSSIFGNSMKTTSSIFGTPATTVTSLFGSSTTNTSGFGSSIQTATVFGSPTTTSSSIFGNPTSSASSCSSIFGSASTTTSSIFGAPVTTSTTSSIFGSPSTTAASSGLFGSVAAAANQSSSFGQPSLGFSSPGSAFGNISLFGQQACSPSQPSSSFTPAVNPFAVNKTSSSTPSLFTNQKSLFGQPTASATNTGFGVANSGFGSIANSGFGSPAMSSSQSSNLGFGSPPMFGSMGTTYDMSKSSGFGQAPVFGGAATFGSTPPAQYTFGQNSSTPESGCFGFGTAVQQPSTAFASLATQNNTPSFGNIAQNQNSGFASPTTPGFGQQQQTSPFKPQGATFGGSSFNSWR
ncbi:nuclear pore complex protein Nup214-like isoform X2 [Sipha flava]|uniref:Nuclear pore complex protein Nup214-like isoform X2 n=1 Tax=Sipha flava TaxID=143950 RepID=A0A8B8FHU7_9HEMI|nr:nuclear pore complex protein Nup214-like isoform X2 [Sipha flava]